MDIEKALKYFNIFTGENAISHLLKVACGIDSMVLGEDEILRQVKESYYFAMENNETMAPTLGLEPRTRSLTDCCSNQLS